MYFGYWRNDCDIFNPWNVVRITLLQVDYLKGSAFNTDACANKQFGKPCHLFRIAGSFSVMLYTWDLLLILFYVVLFITVLQSGRRRCTVWQVCDKRFQINTCIMTEIKARKMKMLILGCCSALRQMRWAWCGWWWGSRAASIISGWRSCAKWVPPFGWTVEEYEDD